MARLGSWKSLGYWGRPTKEVSEPSSSTQACAQRFTSPSSHIYKCTMAPSHTLDTCAHKHAHAFCTCLLGPGPGLRSPCDTC